MLLFLKSFELKFADINLPKSAPLYHAVEIGDVALNDVELLVLQQIGKKIIKQLSIRLRLSPFHLCSFFRSRLIIPKFVSVICSMHAAVSSGTLIDTVYSRCFVFNS